MNCKKHFSSTKKVTQSLRSMAARVDGDMNLSGGEKGPGFKVEGLRHTGPGAKVGGW